MVKPAPTLREAESLVIELEAADARGDAGAVTSRMNDLEDAIAFLMDLNYRLAGNHRPNALAASLQLRARKLRERHRTGRA